MNEKEDKSKQMIVSSYLLFRPDINTKYIIYDVLGIY